MSREANKIEADILHREKVKLKKEIEEFKRVFFGNENVPSVQFLQNLLNELKQIVLINERPEAMYV